MTECSCEWPAAECAGTCDWPPDADVAAFEDARGPEVEVR